MAVPNVVAIVSLTIAGAAIAGVLAAGRRYVRGEIEQARSIARPAGFTAAGAGLSAVAGLAITPGLGASAAPHAHALVVAAFIAGAGFVALLGGLSGKPRPAGEAAALLWLAALVALLSGW